MIPNAAASDIGTKLYAHVMGSVMIGFGVTISLISRSIMQGPRAAAQAMLTGAWSWFVVDTVGSLLHGSWQNAIFNLIGWVFLIPPLLLLKRSLTPTGA